MNALRPRASPKPSLLARWEARRVGLEEEGAAMAGGPVVVARGALRSTTLR